MGTCWRLTPHSSMWGCSAVRVSSSAFGRLRGNEMNGFLTSCYIHFKTFRENVDVMVFFFFFFCFFTIFSSLQFNHSVLSNSLRPHGLQLARPPCPSLTPGVYSDSCPLSRRCILTLRCLRGFLPGKRASSRKRLQPWRLQGSTWGGVCSEHRNALSPGASCGAGKTTNPPSPTRGLWEHLPRTWAPRPRIPLLLAGGPGRTHSHPTPHSSSV